MKTAFKRSIWQVALASAFITCAATSLAQVKVGVIQGLSGPPAVVDFGEVGEGDLAGEKRGRAFFGVDGIFQFGETVWACP